MRRPIDPSAQIAEHPAHFVCIGSRGKNPVLRPLELGRGHHLHGLRDLLGILERRNLAAKTLETRHFLQESFHCDIAPVKSSHQKLIATPNNGAIVND